MHQLVVIHRKKPERFPELPSGWRVFETCLRSLAISFEKIEFPAMHESDQRFEGEAAYELLLDVACGLKSPITGETEVFGQFRQFADAWTGREAFFQRVYSEVKAVRQKHLSHLGSQSYGSWVRKRVLTHEPVHILGTGQLACEIAVWLRKREPRIYLYSRSPISARKRLREQSILENVEVRQFDGATDISGTLIVAAPVSSVEIKRWLGDCRPGLTIDLRSDSSTDALELRPIERLNDVFEQIESGRARASDKIQLARKMIQEIISRRFQSETIRPFGWDDVCA